MNTILQDLSPLSLAYALDANELFLDAGVAAINHVVTIPQFRRQGIGAMMTLMAAREARQVGYRIGVLTASSMGINIYRRLGFKECCLVSIYEWSPTNNQKDTTA